MTGCVDRYLLTYDALAFHAYLETLIAANSVSVSGGPKVNHSPWMLTDAANIIFKEAKRRCYTLSAPISKGGSPSALWVIPSNVTNVHML
jgi:DNA excision repair protein ERCC-4